jgi:hypothetical protein
VVAPYWIWALAKPAERVVIPSLLFRGRQAEVPSRLSSGKGEPAVRQLQHQLMVVEGPAKQRQTERAAAIPVVLAAVDLR